MRQWLLTGAIVLAAVGLPAIVGNAAVNHANNLAYENAVASCERVNTVRSVVYRNTLNAVHQSERAGDPPEVTEVFKENLETLQSVPTTDPRTGEVNCKAVVEEP